MDRQKLLIYLVIILGIQLKDIKCDDWIKVADKKECYDPSGKVNIVHNQVKDVGDCAKLCRRKSSMFAFGTDDFGTNRCNTKGCRCLCEVSAKQEYQVITCTQVINNGYRLYRFKTNLDYLGEKPINGTKVLKRTCIRGPNDNACVGSSESDPVACNEEKCPLTCNADFIDKWGDNCQRYGDNNWCNSTGGYGDNWKQDWGKFEDYTTDQGENARLCPQCGCSDACIWAEWQDWSTCSLTCGDGRRNRVRMKYKMEQLGGYCDSDKNPQVESVSCNTQPCPVTCDTCKGCISNNKCTSYDVTGEKGPRNITECTQSGTDCLGYEACKASCKWYYTFQSNDISATDEDICKLDSAPGNCYNPTYYPFCTEDPKYSICSKKQDEYIYFTDCEKDDDCTEERPICGDFGVCIGRDVCTDIPYYSDKKGMTCKKAVESGKCSNARPVGDTEDERKKIEEELDGNKNSDGVSLMDACCECGGGQAIPAPKPSGHDPALCREYKDGQYQSDADCISCNDQTCDYGSGGYSGAQIRNFSPATRRPGTKCNRITCRLANGHHDVWQNRKNKVEFTKLKNGQECKSRDVSYGTTTDAKECAYRCTFFDYFVLGTENKKCYCEKTLSSSCPEGWKPNKYDFYEITLRGDRGCDTDMDCVGKDKTGKAKDKTTPFCNKYGNMKMCGGSDADDCWAVGDAIGAWTGIRTSVGTKEECKKWIQENISVENMPDAIAFETDHQYEYDPENDYDKNFYYGKCIAVYKMTGRNDDTNWISCKLP